MMFARETVGVGNLSPRRGSDLEHMKIANTSTGAARKPKMLEEARQCWSFAYYFGRIVP
jgi:hypothetical protein